MTALLAPLVRRDATSGRTADASLKAGRREAVLVAPVLVLASEYLAFQSLTATLGPRLGWIISWASPPTGSAEKWPRISNSSDSACTRRTAKSASGASSVHPSAVRNCRVHVRASRDHRLQAPRLTLPRLSLPQCREMRGVAVAQCSVFVAVRETLERMLTNGL
jgi:hypothetical protein